MGNNAHITVRPLTASDRAAWDRLWEGYLRYYETELDAKVYETTFARLLSEDPNEFHGLLACVDGQPVGLVHYLFHRHAWKAENVCYLQDLYADPSVRGKGVGRALIEAVYDAADRNGTPSVYWLTQDFNHTARALYDRIGVKTPFIRYGRA
ncbi:GNAT family N-acetyltransferase [uncultured Aliiroseovarius sp.]|uniref:GNAT family N-acetyltransferase n=1 Tax=uncultured Aliiroseovarius sp. TaxID=1658783 RepID=UPI00260D6D3D|nr:GNAT family N-acetyltransferase [uncultured Aliiroseovarius sp.]